MLVRSPMFTNSESSSIVSGSRPGQAHRGHRLGGLARRGAVDDVRDAGDVGRGGAAAPADQVDQTCAGELREHLRHLVRRLVVLTEGVGQPGVGVARDEAVGDPRELGQVGADLGGAEGAVEADRQRPGVAHRVPEGLGDLAREGPPGRVGDRAGQDHRPAPATLLEERLEGEDRGLGVERVEDRLHQEQVGAAVDQARGLLGVRLHELLEAGVAEARVVDVGRDRGGAVGRAQTAGDVARPVGLGVGDRVRGLAGQPGRLEVQLVGEVLHAVVGLGDALGAEGVRRDDVGAGLEVLAVDGPDDVGLAQAEQVAVAAHLLVPVGEPVAAVARLVEPVALDHRAHRAVDHQDALAQERRQRLGGVGALLGAAVLGSGHRCTPVVFWGMQTA